MKHSKNTDLVRFLKKITFLLIAILILDFTIGSALRYYFFKEKFNSVTYVMNTTKAGFLVFGSSRASHHYEPDAFKEKFHTSFYNCGHDSYRMIYHLAAISAVLERYTPKYLVLDLDPADFEQSEENSLNMLLPYKDNPAVREYIKYNGKFEKYKMISKIYPYNSLIGDIIMGSISTHKAGFGTGSEGYVQLNAVMPDTKMALASHDQIIPERVAILDDFLAGLHKRNINITIVISPIYYHFKPNDPTVEIIESLCRKYPNVSFINYENDPAFLDESLFNEEIHMNGAGAGKFSIDLANRLVHVKHN